MSSHATMRDVAALAGVSLKTVSRVVNLETGVSDDLATRVRRAAQQLNYRHNLEAGNLRRHRRTTSIAVLVQDLSNGYSAGLLRAIDDEARGRGVVMLSASLDEEEERERLLVANLISRRVDGLILMPASHDQSYLHSDLRAGFAVVMIDRRPRHIGTDFVVVDNRAGARQATRHLIGYGHRRIAFIGDDPAIATAAERRDGYLAALGEAGIPVDETLMFHGRTKEFVADVVHGLWRRTDRPTALFSARNTLTSAAVLALHQMHLSRTVALIGFDAVEVADLVEPGITLVEQDPAHVGQVAAQLLFARLGGQAAPTRGIVLPTTLVERGSGEIPATTAPG